MFKIRGEIFRLDILDTSGNDPFPAIKKLNIMTGNEKKSSNHLYIKYLNQISPNISAIKFHILIKICLKD